MYVNGPVEVLSKTKAIAVVPSDTVALVGGTTKGLYVGGAGNVVVTMVGGGDATFIGLAVGVVHNISVTHIKLTGTTATTILALY